ncbi:carboxypeptidase regulatory-like domain-containing protein [Cocleimonas sp. KMM 6892]|uniref:SdrD B-like domain-containing protein n=1 Tax=unclassified Cocleimonas TaxID=2639732 RepID=UPI002DBE5458|nr:MULTISPECIES: SdrD B-like domain-containing protein [unclassified Cocleimonas]MEB8433490.1 carboxypeptidase regulatory-like domain-containing protein [Cocleimonas sp. KMM 6892]MEC4716301.1 carboxypeptidase regulatory-like domain-containing protein [Cocleimonas sp. KMM 6895]MEC4745806.1 carboxypeptidase regulatory-like domain-containing protein [Cocleimonas sp. KMM 6896]
MIINTLTIFSLLLHKFDSFFKFVLASLFIVSTTVIHAATPVVNTTITLEKTGSEPFDTGVSWTGDGPGGVDGGVNAGLDADENNNIVRLQDSITYRVEVSVNDSDVEDLTATVTLNEKQKWITIPTGCKTDPSEVGSEGISEIRNSDTELFCNMGPAIEGTTRVFFPAARAVGLDPLTGDVTRNDDIVTAGVVAEAVSVENGNSAPASDGPTSVVVTGFFRVDLQKELKSTAVDPDTGASLYSAPLKKGPTGRAGSIIEYTVLAEYVKGSLLADGDNDTTSGGSPGIASYRIIDVLTDDNEHNNTATLSTGAQLYTWDSLTPACELLGDHGAAASVTCTQLSAAIDDIGPGASAPDGLNDLVIQIDLDNIDVSDPDNDANLFEVRLNVWFDKVNDIDNHQTCNELNQPECINTTTNRVGFWDGSSTILDSFDETNDNAPTGNNPGIVSTEDSAGNHVNNYNAGEEPFPNEVSYPLTTSSPGSFVVHKAFTNLFPFADRKFPDQNMAAGETRPFLMNVYDYRLIDQAETQVCDKIDTQVFEYAGVAPPNQIGSPALYGWNQNQPWNPVVSTWGGAVGTTLADGSSLVNFLFSNYPYVADPVTNQAGYLEELRTASCNDDINNDGFVVIQNEDGSLVDENGDAATGTIIDWWRNADDVPPLAGGAGADENVTRVRQNSIYDAALATAQDSTHKNFAVTVNHLITAKLITASPYGTNNRLPNFASYNRQEADGTYTGWTHVGANTVDPSADATFAIQSGTVDRMTLVPSSHSIEKYTEPRGIKVVRGGDTVDFIIEPAVFGLWDDTSVNTATIGDNLPNGTDYIANSEMFSSDGGTTWYTRAEWDARFNGGMEDVSVTSAAHAGGADPLSWVFGSLNSSGGNSDQLPLIKYSVYVDPARVSGTFVNTATINSGIIGGGVKQAKYQLTILPEFGLDVLKSVDETVYQTNSPFTFDLVYKNLGGEDYSGAEFIDILPYNGDAGTTTGGLNSTRDPQSQFNGTYEVTSISKSNGEIFYATVMTPSNIEEDPCHASNLPNGYDPDEDGGVCNRYFDNNGSLPGGGTVGTNSTGWVQCTALSPLACGGLANADITAIKFTVPTLAATDGGQTVSIEITPAGNVGGTPSFDSEGKVTDASTGDIYTNTFGGRIPEISLNVISNDVSVTVVAGAIESILWVDGNGDGDQDAGEPGIGGITVNLLDGSGNPIYFDPITGGIVSAGTSGAIPYVTETSTDGSYSFDNLPAGDYQVQVDFTDTDFPADTVPFFDGDGSTSANISNLTLGVSRDPITGELTNVVDNTEQNFGYIVPPAIGNFVWNDLNGDGIQDADEPGVDGVTVTLLDNNGDTVSTTTTSNGGAYSFSDLEPGTYSVKFTDIPSGYIVTNPNQGGDDTLDSDASAADVPTDTVTITYGDYNDTLDLGLVTASLGDFVWNDVNHNGIQDTGETGVEGVTVFLLDENGVRTGEQTTTDSDGFYQFTNLLPGDSFGVEFDLANLPTGYEATIKDAGSDDTKDSDADTTTGKTTPVELGPAENNTGFDLGIFQRVSLGSSVFIDSNNNGVHDEGESGIEGLTIQLFNEGDDPTSATPVKETDTNSAGDYLFSDLVPGSYFVYIPNPPIEAPFSSTDIVSSATDNQVDGDDNGQQVVSGGPVQSPVIELISGDEPVDGTEANSEKDTGTNTTGKFLDSSFDENGDMTIDFGFVPSSIGDTIWQDVDYSGGTAPNAGDIPLADVEVTLTPASGVDAGAGDGVAITTTTDSNGKYLFELLPPGEYTITVDSTSGDLGANSDLSIFVDPEGEKDSSSRVNLASGEQNLDQDFAYAELVSLGSSVFVDSNNNALHDEDESGFEGLTIQLFNEGDDPTSATPVKETDTDSEGDYLFSDLIPGSYFVYIPTPPVLAPLSSIDIASSGADNQIDGDDNGQQVASGGPVQSPVIVLTSGGEPVDGTGANSEKDAGTNLTGKLQDASNDASGDMTIDFGFVPSAIGDTIWYDVDSSGGTEPNAGDIPLADVIVILTPASGVDAGAGDGVAITTTTDSNGNYLFELLPPGEYTITVDTASGDLGDNLDLYVFVAPEGAIESISTVNLASGEQNLDQDFAYTELGVISGNVSIDTDGDDIGDEPMSGVLMRLLDNEGNPVMDSEGNPITALTDELGNYSFANIIPGDYQVAQSQPVGYQSTTGEGQPDDLISAINVNGGETAVSNDFVERVVNPANIPTLSEWAMIFLVMMLGLISQREALARRRRY